MTKEERQATLRGLKELGGLTFGDCIEAFGVLAENNTYIQEAKSKFSDDDIEVDDIAVISELDDDGSGLDDAAWVQAWVYVSISKSGAADPTGIKIIKKDSI